VPRLFELIHATSNARAQKGALRAARCGDESSTRPSSGARRSTPPTLFKTVYKQAAAPGCGGERGAPASLEVLDGFESMASAPEG
jgi:hypothetical protein